NGSAMLVVGAKISQFALLPQGRVEAARRAQNMVTQMDEEGFGNCTNTGACEVECPKGITLENIARMNREFLKAKITSEEKEIKIGFYKLMIIRPVEFPSALFFVVNSFYESK